ncbi:MAG: dicarboxylate/amino acid:cation symporter [Candidatus Marinimicrobia bacterium]|nr:dicarboxylate/amino acid:cation symporter [Candidatus Neomarinimicrobiota bacterium]
MKLKLHWKIFIGMALGALLAFVSPAAAMKVAPLGDIFMRLLKMVIVPLIFTSITAGVAGIGDSRNLGRLGGKTFLYYIVTSALAIMVGLALVNIIQPGVGLVVAQEQMINPDDLEQPGSVVDILMRIIPINPVQAAASGDILGVIFFAIFFGFAITRLPTAKAKPVLSFFQSAFEAMMQVTHAVISLAPIGVFGLISRAVVSMGGELFQAVGLYMITIAAGLTIHFLVILPVLFFLLTRRNPLDHYRAMAAVMAMAFSTSSSSATLPLTLEAVEKKAGVSNKISSFVLPMGSTVNMDGTALYECAGVIFIAQALGIDLTFGQQLVVVITALLASIGAAGVPSAGLVMIFIVLEAVGITTPAAYALVGVMLAVDRPLDMFRTVVNVTSDSIGAVVIAHSEGEQLNYPRLGSDS